MQKILTPEKVRLMQFPSGDTSSYNTISKPFKDIFSNVVYLKALTPEEGKIPIFNRHYKVRVVEALAGMWLSRVTQYVLGKVAAAYDPYLIGLIEKEAAKALQKHGVVGGGSSPNFPDVYKKGNVPSGYDPTDFNPDEIYPGQRFILFEAVEQIVFDPEPVNVPNSFWKNVWIGAVWGAQADLGIGGSHANYGGVFSLSDLMEYEEMRRFSGLAIHGWRVGLGAGVSSGATLVIFVNYPTIESLNMYTDDGWDWDIAIGAKVPKGAPKAVKALFDLVYSLKGVKKFTKTGKKGDSIKTLVETIIKNLKGGLPSNNSPFMIALPVPFTGPGLHLWVGRKTSQYETFWANEFGEAKK